MGLRNRTAKRPARAEAHGLSNANATCDTYPGLLGNPRDVRVQKLRDVGLVNVSFDDLVTKMNLMSVVPVVV